MKDDDVSKVMGETDFIVSSLKTITEAASRYT